MIKIPSIISDETKELIDSIMLTFEDDAKYDALQMFIILQRATDDDLQLLNKILIKTIDCNQHEKTDYLSIVRSDIKTNKALIRLQQIIPESTLSDIIKMAIHFLARTRTLPIEKQLLLTTLYDK